MNIGSKIGLILTWMLTAYSMADESTTLINGSEWMKILPEETSLTEVSLIGSHDSCALHGGVYAECQALTLGQQLQQGVRFLDIRCKLVRGELKIFHGIADQKMTFIEVREICHNFLKKNPSEVVLMSVKYEGNKAPKADLFGDAFKTAQRGYEKLFYQKAGKNAELPTIGAVRGKVVIITRDREVAGISWSGFQIQDAYRLSGKDALKRKWVIFQRHFGRINNLVKKPSINFLSGSGLLFPPKSNAEKLNPKLKAFLKESLTKKVTPHLGIVGVDYVDRELCELMIKLNQRHLMQDQK